MKPEDPNTKGEQEEFEPEEHPEGHLIEEHLDADGSTGRRRRRKIKIRKRVKIKRKSTPKKKVRKAMQTLSWILIVAAFLITLIILVLQLDFSAKNKKRKSVDRLPYATEQTLHIPYKT